MSHKYTIRLSEKQLQLLLSAISDSAYNLQDSIDNEESSVVKELDSLNALHTLIAQQTIWKEQA